MKNINKIKYFCNYDFNELNCNLILQWENLGSAIKPNPLQPFFTSYNMEPYISITRANCASIKNLKSSQQYK